MNYKITVEKIISAENQADAVAIYRDDASMGNFGAIISVTENI